MTKTIKYHAKTRTGERQVTLTVNKTEETYEEIINADGQEVPITKSKKVVKIEAMKFMNTDITDAKFVNRQGQEVELRMSGTFFILFTLKGQKGGIEVTDEAIEKIFAEEIEEIREQNRRENEYYESRKAIYKAMDHYGDRAANGIYGND